MIKYQPSKESTFGEHNHDQHHSQNISSRAAALPALSRHSRNASPSFPPFSVCNRTRSISATASSSAIRWRANGTSRRRRWFRSMSTRTGQRFEPDASQGVRLQSVSDHRGGSVLRRVEIGRRCRPDYRRARRISKKRQRQILYPRFEFFEQVTKVFEADGRSVPVYNDKHLSTASKKPRKCATRRSV